MNLITPYVNLKKEICFLGLLILLSFTSFNLHAQVDYFNVEGGWAGNDANGNAIIKWTIVVCVDELTTGVIVKSPADPGEGVGVANVKGDEDSPLRSCGAGSWYGQIDGAKNNPKNTVTSEITPPGGLTIEASGCATLAWTSYSKDYDSNSSDQDHYVIANVVSDSLGQTVDPGFDCTAADSNGNNGCTNGNTNTTTASCINRIDCDDVETHNYEQILGLAVDFIDTIHYVKEGYVETIFAYVACHHGESDYEAGYDTSTPGNNTTVDIIPDTIVDIEILITEWNRLSASGPISLTLDSIRLENPGIQWLQPATGLGPYGTVVPHTNNSINQPLTDKATSFLPMDVSQNNQNDVDGANCGSFLLQCDTVYVHSYYTVGFSAPSGEQCKNYYVQARASNYLPKNGYQSTDNDDGIAESPPVEISTSGMEPDPEYGDCSNSDTGTCSAAPGEDCSGLGINICCTPPPPVEIGNFVWEDLDGNGFQDLGENGIEGINMELYDVNGLLVGTTTTDSNGEYIFSLSNVDTTGNNGASGFTGMSTFATYYIVAGNGQFSSNQLNDGNALFELTTDNISSATLDSLDSDGIVGNPGFLSDDFPYLTLNTGDVSSVKYNYDFGFVPVYDWGDLPDNGLGTSMNNYETDTLNNGPFHRIINNLYLGSLVDSEYNGQQSVLSDGDDSNGINDEDAIFFPTTMEIIPNGTMNIPLSVFNATGDTAHIEMWIDWNGDGDFSDSGEWVVDINDGNGANPFPISLGFTIPVDAVQYQSVGVRIRLSNEDDMTPYGFALTGEVEDYLIEIQCGDGPCLNIFSSKQ